MFLMSEVLLWFPQSGAGGRATSPGVHRGVKRLFWVPIGTVINLRSTPRRDRI